MLTGIQTNFICGVHSNIIRQWFNDDSTNLTHFVWSQIVAVAAHLESMNGIVFPQPAVGESQRPHICEVLSMARAVRELTLTSLHLTDSGRPIISEDSA